MAPCIRSSDRDSGLCRCCSRVCRPQRGAPVAQRTRARGICTGYAGEGLRQTCLPPRSGRDGDRRHHQVASDAAPARPRAAGGARRARPALSECGRRRGADGNCPGSDARAALRECGWRSGRDGGLRGADCCDPAEKGCCECRSIAPTVVLIHHSQRYFRLKNADLTCLSFECVACREAASLA